jgi:hypothetical protein
VVVDLGEAGVFIGQFGELREGVGGGELSAANVFEHLENGIPSHAVVFSFAA